MTGLQHLRRNVLNYNDPDSVRILKNKIDKEREYLQRTIIMMELKQFAESIALISDRRKSSMLNLEKVVRNRPLLWAQRLQQIEQKKLSRYRGFRDHKVLSLKQQFDNEWKVSDDYLYFLRFDPSTGVDNSWVDSKVLNYFNAQRDNIFASSSKYDIVQLRQEAAQFYTSYQRKPKNKKTRKRDQQTRAKSVPPPKVKRLLKD